MAYLIWLRGIHYSANISLANVTVRTIQKVSEVSAAERLLWNSVGRAWSGRQSSAFPLTVGQRVSGVETRGLDHKGGCVQIFREEIWPKERIASSSISLSYQYMVYWEERGAQKKKPCDWKLDKSGPCSLWHTACTLVKDERARVCLIQKGCPIRKGEKYVSPIEKGKQSICPNGKLLYSETAKWVNTTELEKLQGRWNTTNAGGNEIKWGGWVRLSLCIKVRPNQCALIT